MDWLYGLASNVEKKKNKKEEFSVYHKKHSEGIWNPEKDCLLHALKIKIPTKGKSALFIQQINEAGFGEGYPIHWDTYIIHGKKIYLERRKPIFEDKY